MPFYEDYIAPSLKQGRNVLVVTTWEFSTCVM